MKRTGFERIMLRNGYEMHRRAFVTKTNMASLLSNHFVAEALQGTNYLVG